MNDTWTGAVLAGGRSRRMGRPKAFLPGPGGKPLIEAALDALRAAGATHLRISANDAAAYTHLGVEVVPDGPAGARTGEGGAVGGGASGAPAARGSGPLAGLEALLRAAPSEWCLVVACDMPLLDPVLLRRVIDRALAAPPTAPPPASARPQPLEAVVPTAAGRSQPLHAAYHRRALPKLEAALVAGRLRLSDAVASLEVAWLPLPPGPAFENLNTPEDLRRLIGGREPPRPPVSAPG